MAKISELPPLVAVDGAETVPVVQDGVTMAAKLGPIVAHAAAPHVASARDYANEAELARDVMFASADRFPSIAAGLAATAEGSDFWVYSEGDIMATAYRKQNGAAKAINRMLGQSGVLKLAMMAERFKDIRPTLRGAFAPSSADPSMEFYYVASDIINGCRVVSTDPTATVLWRPSTGTEYPFVWTRDMAMAMWMAPLFFSASDIYGAYSWIRARVNLPLVEFGQHSDRFGTPCDRDKRYVQDDYWVPDHLGYDGVPRYYPGADNFGQRAPNTYGHRAPLCGNPMLVFMAHTHFAKTNDLSLYLNDADFLLNVLDKLPRDPASGLVAVDPARPCVSWGFIDTVLLVGGVAFASVLTFIAYQQLAEMAFQAGDTDRAQRCLEAADTLSLGLQSLYRTLELTGSPNGLILASNGNVSSGQFDLWASVLACKAGALPEQMQQGIASALVGYFLRPPVNGMNEVFSWGGLRHVPVSNDFEPGVRMWESTIFGDPFELAGYHLYQDGGYWFTPTAWAIEAVGRYFPVVANRMRQLILSRFNLETRTKSEGEYIFPTEWVAGKADNPEFGAIRYMTSAAALISAPGSRSGPSLTGCGTKLTIAAKRDANGALLSQPLPANVYVPVEFDRVVYDELGGFEPTMHGIRVITPGTYRISLGVYFGRRGDGKPVGTHSGAIYVNGNQAYNYGPRYVGADIEGQILATFNAKLAKSDLVQGWCVQNQQGAGGADLIVYAPDDSINAQYSYLVVEYVGP